MYILLKSKTLQFIKWMASTERAFRLPVGLVLFLVKISNIFGKFKAGRTSLEPR